MLTVLFYHASWIACYLVFANTQNEDVSAVTPKLIYTQNNTLEGQFCKNEIIGLEY